MTVKRTVCSLVISSSLTLLRVHSYQCFCFVFTFINMLKVAKVWRKYIVLFNTYKLCKSCFGYIQVLSLDDMLQAMQGGVSLMKQTLQEGSVGFKQPIPPENSFNYLICAIMYRNRNVFRNCLIHNILQAKSRDVKCHLEFLLFLSFSHPVTAVLILFSQETRLGLCRSWQPEQLALGCLNCCAVSGELPLGSGNTSQS